MRVVRLLPLSYSVLAMILFVLPVVHFVCAVRVTPLDAQSILSVLRSAQHWLVQDHDVARFSQSSSAFKETASILWLSRTIRIIDHGDTIAVRNPHSRPQLIRFGADGLAYYVAPRSTETFQKALVGDNPTYTVHPITTPLSLIHFHE